jgi:hypothetical protein
MADYATPTVVRPNIPADAITMLELTVLTQMFEWERDGDGVYFFAEGGLRSDIRLDVAQMRELIEAAPDERSSIIEVLRGTLEELNCVEGAFDLDVSGFESERIFQDILHRVADISHIAIVSGWTCSKMRVDGFGGAVTVITRDQIQSVTTNEMEERLCDLASYGEIGCAPGKGEHRVLTLREEEVRAMANDIGQSARDHGERVVTITDVDIREGCCAAISTCLLDAYRRNLAFSAAQSATRIAWERTDQPST